MAGGRDSGDTTILVHISRISSKKNFVCEDLWDAIDQMRELRRKFRASTFLLTINAIKIPTIA